MKSILLSACLLAVFSCQARQEISESEVKRIISTLAADDMQGRKVFTPGIEKAAAFIRSEFDTIGLLPFDGNTDYTQDFITQELKSAKITLQVNGVSVPASGIISNTSQKELFWSDQTDGLTVRKIAAKDTFGKVYSEIYGLPGNVLVFIDTAHAKVFNQMKGFFGSRKVSFADPSSPNRIFVLTGSRDIKNFKISVQNQFDEKPMANVVGVLPGKSRVEEYVIFSAHYDHIGIQPAKAGDSIANGADDDASGVTAVISLARYFKQMNNNERTLIFVTFTAEEIGGYGSQYFSKQLDPEKVVAMFNIEMIGKPSKFGPNSGFITGFDKTDFGSILQKNLLGSPYNFHPDPYIAEDLFYRSDNATLAKLGVPAHSISTDQIDRDPHYHQVSDEVGTLDLEHLTNIIRAIAQSAGTIVSGVDTPTRNQVDVK